MYISVWLILAQTSLYLMYFNVVASRWALLVSGQPVLGQVEGPLLFCLPLGAPKDWLQDVTLDSCHCNHYYTAAPMPPGHKKQQWVWEPPQWEPKPVLWAVLPSPTLSALPLPPPLGGGREMVCRLKSKHPLFPSPGKKIGIFVQSGDGGTRRRKNF